MATKYPGSYEAVSKKCDAVGFEALSEKEQAIYTMWWLEAEVNNGGFHQYFWNSAGDHTKVALESLSRGNNGDILVFDSYLNLFAPRLINQNVPIYTFTHLRV
jgi:hypothetical protein